MEGQRYLFCSLSQLTPQMLFHLSLVVRIPEPQRPHVKPPEDIVRANHYDPEEDEEYHREAALLLRSEKL